MNNGEDLYKILEVSKNASSENIKKSFRRLSLLNHPDKNDNNQIKTDKFKQINKAYEILSNPDKRKQYDNQCNFPINFGKMGETNEMAHIDEINELMTEIFKFGSIPIYSQMYRFPSYNNVNFSNRNKSNVTMNNSRFQTHDDILNMFFGEEHLYNNYIKREKKIEKPEAIVINLEIQIKEAYTGCSLPFEIDRWIIENNSRRNEKEKIYINIPKGIDNNELITLEGQGNIAENNTKGDIRIFVKIINNPEFEREGLDLIYKKNLTIKEILCGYEFDIKYIDDRIFKIVNNKGNESILLNFKKIIPNLGMERDNIKGNLILDFTINNSQKLDKEQLDKLREML